MSEHLLHKANLPCLPVEVRSERTGFRKHSFGDVHVRATMNDPDANAILVLDSYTSGVLIRNAE